MPRRRAMSVGPMLAALRAMCRRQYPRVLSNNRGLGRSVLPAGASSTSETASTSAEASASSRAGETVVSYAIAGKSSAVHPVIGAVVAMGRVSDLVVAERSGLAAAHAI